VGRAGFILDNLIADKKAKPMIVAMPAGHTRTTMFGGRGAAPAREGSNPPPADEFVQDFLNDLQPYVEQHYRVIADPAHRAIAGLSMGGSQTLNIALPRLGQFAYVGVFSSGLGLGGGRGRGATPTATASSTPVASPWEQAHLDVLDNVELKKSLKLLWFSTGQDDFVINSTKSTVEMLKKHGFNLIYQESSGGHTWINWRHYLNEFAPQLFQ
jgi:enterochelin esterase family protein